VLAVGYSNFPSRGTNYTVLGILLGFFFPPFGLLPSRARPHNRRRIRQQFAGHGVDIPVICTPEELIGDDGYEDNN